MVEKARPRLHLVGGDFDPELYNADLDWYHGCYSSECGIKSIGASGVEYLYATTGNTRKSQDDFANPLSVNVSAGHQGGTSDPYSDRHVNLSSDSGSFTRGRRIWARLTKLVWWQQELVASYYEPRQFEPKKHEEKLVRHVHRAYLQTGVSK